MADRVPTAGPWQNDPTIREFMAWFRAQPQAPRGSAAAADPTRQSTLLAYQRYIDANRVRLGIPDNYTPDPRTGGQTLYDPNQNQWRDAAITGGAMAGGGYALGNVLGGLASANSTPAAFSPAAEVAGVESSILGGAPAASIAGTTAAGTSAIEKLRNSLTSSQGIGALASLLPALAMAGGGGGGNGAGSEELRRIQGITEARMRRADPLHQAAVQLAFQRAPIKAREGISLANVPLPE